MIELSLEYWNTLANQYILISSLLCGFSITIIANLLVIEKSHPILIKILKTATLSAGSFLVSVFSMTDVLMKTTSGFPYQVSTSDFLFSRTIGGLAFLLGVVCLAIIISLSGWTKSKDVGRFTTIVGVLTLVIMLMTLIDVKF